MGKIEHSFIDLRAFIFYLIIEFREFFTYWYKFSINFMIDEYFLLVCGISVNFFMVF